MALKLWVRTLKLTAFRNYPYLSLDLPPQPIVLVGANGAGKTNLLEAISCLSPGRGLRQQNLRDIQHAQTDPAQQGWTVFADLVTPAVPDLEVRIGTGIEVVNADQVRRIVRINGRKGEATAMRQHLVVSWLTPAMDGLFREGAGGRRRFLDRLVYGFEADHARLVAQYDAIRTQRLSLLKQGVQDRDWLTTLEAQLWEKGQAILAARQRTLARLADFCTPQAGSLFPSALLVLGGDYDPDMQQADFLAQIAQDRPLDRKNGTTRTGVHRMDLSVIHGEKNIQANQCSTGEQKALLIALILANARGLAKITGLAPILLLDEVAAHLDAVRRSALFDEICALNAQVWMTGTDREPFVGLAERAYMLQVEDGSVTPLSSAFEGLPATMTAAL